MDAKESRKYISSNPPVDINAERRPSLLGRLFRMSSTETAPGVMPSATGMGQSFDSASGMPRRDSITEQVQQQMINPPKQAAADPVFNLFT